jgi:hypothetical protein
MLELLRGSRRLIELRIERVLQKMKTKAPVRIIKRDQRNNAESAAEEKAAAKKTPQQTAREMVATVSGWVNEFQQKRRTETTRAIKTLLPKTTPQTGEI